MLKLRHAFFTFLILSTLFASYLAATCASNSDCEYGQVCSGGACVSGGSRACKSYCTGNVDYQTAYYTSTGKCTIATKYDCPYGCNAAGTTCKMSPDEDSTVPNTNTNTNPPASHTCATNEDCGSPTCEVVTANGETYARINNPFCMNGVCGTRSLPCSTDRCASATECAEETNGDKCAGVTCQQQLCSGNTRYYNGQCSPDTGECVYNSFECPLGCDTSTGYCIQEEKITLTGLTIQPGKSSLILNGRDAVLITGTATGMDSAGNTVPYQGDVRFDGSGEASNYRLFGPSAVHVSVDSFATVKDGKFSFYVSSDDKISQKVDLTSAKIIVTSEDFSDVKTEIALISPAPVIKVFKLKSKPSVWQDSYGVFEVQVVDPDSNIKKYTVKSEEGALRLYGVDWEDEKQISYDSNSPTFQFGWKAPKLTQELKLDYTKKIYNRIKTAVTQIGTKLLKDTVDKKLKQRALQTGGKSGVRWTPNTDEMQEFVEAAVDGQVLNTSNAVAKFVVSRHRISRTAYKNTNAFISSVYDRGEAFVELYKVQEEAVAEVANQAQEMGAASTEDASFFEYAARVGIIGIQGYQMYDGVMTASGKIAGEESDESLMGTVKDSAKELTIGVMQDSLVFVADNYKAARAKMISLPFIIKLEVTDEDGYTATKGVLVEVEGYETVIS
ncbi:Uncharacterised protein [Candidatus Gugararchaeum adminiculabundum]|nr:Uncharacterised protein [Candidatus Gugararchaeum adminiculabundum]